MRVLVDTNVLIDALLLRQPWAQAAEELWQASVNARFEGYITATTLTDVFYICRKPMGNDAALNSVRFCMVSFGICSVTRAELAVATEHSGTDFEDNLQIACATANAIETIVTRDEKGFAGSSISVLSPEQFLTTIKRA